MKLGFENKINYFYFLMILEVPTPKSDCTFTKYTPAIKSETLI